MDLVGRVFRNAMFSILPARGNVLFTCRGSALSSGVMVNCGVLSFRAKHFDSITGGVCLMAGFNDDCGTIVGCYRGCVLAGTVILRGSGIFVLGPGNSTVLVSASTSPV